MVISALMILGGLLLMVSACALFVTSAMPSYGSSSGDFGPRQVLIIALPMFLAGAALLDEVEALRHDLERHMDIATAEASRARELESALRRILEHCANTGLPNEIVADRVIDRIDEEARDALKEDGE